MRIRHFTTVAGFCLLLSLAGRLSAQVETNAQPLEVPDASSDASSSNDTLRAYLQLQQQIHDTQLSIEAIRREAEETTARNAAALADQLRAVEQSLSTQRARESHFMVYVLGAFAGVSFLAVVITAYFQWRTVNRLADFTAALPSARSVGAAAAVGSIGFGEGAMLAAGSVEQSSGRLLGAIDRLEKRIRELEHAATPALNGFPQKSDGHESSADNQGGGAAATLFVPETETITSDADETPAKLLLEQGQVLLNEDKPEAAIEKLDQLLTMENKNAEALVKKGAALERLRKYQEAIECYDRAIAIDGAMTIAYLHKGGLYNRMERFGEAVECYEQALRTQEKKSAA
ncbi:MAG: tetratricopeptide repeat protein [Verrucomicrobiota bacterium]